MTETAEIIASALGEKNIIGIQKVVEVIGETRALSYLAETVRVEEKGGLMTKKGKRRRTRGGVWFHLVRKGVSPDERKRIFT